MQTDQGVVEPQAPQEDRLKIIVWLACRDKEFLEKVLTDAKGAAEGIDVVLSGAELQTLKRQLNQKKVISGRQMLALYSGIYRAILGEVSATTKPIPVPTPPPPPPPPWWPPDDVIGYPVARKVKKARKGAARGKAKRKGKSRRR